MGLPNSLGKDARFKQNGSNRTSFDNSGTAYLPSGETSFTIPTGYMSNVSIVMIQPINASDGVIPLVEVTASRTYGSNGSFLVKLQDASAALADLYFTWLVIN